MLFDVMNKQYHSHEHTKNMFIQETVMPYCSHHLAYSHHASSNTCDYCTRAVPSVNPTFDQIQAEVSSK